MTKFYVILKIDLMRKNIFRFFTIDYKRSIAKSRYITTMQTSVEARVLFLDHKTIEFVI